MIIMTLPSELIALVVSFSTYRLIHGYANGPNPSLARQTAVIRATSTFHSSVVTVLATHFLRRCKAQWSETDLGGRLKESSTVNWHGRSYPDDSTNPLLQTRSRFGNVIAAIECGYLLQDTISLLREARRRLDLLQPGRKPTLRSLLKYVDRTLLFHHVGIAMALLVLQYYIHQGRERGIYIIVQFLLMNGSTPFLNIRWWLRTYHSRSTILCLLSDFAFVAAFYVARIWSVGWIIKGYGNSHGYDNAWDVFLKRMRLPCQMGTGALWIANTAWWILLVKSILKRLPRELSKTSKAIHVD